jgi:signal transduction histidine kinase/MFS family permease
VSSSLSSRLRDRRVSRRRLLAAGLLLAVCTVVLGIAGELWRFGLSDAAAAARVEQKVRRDFAAMTAILSQIAAAVAGDPAAAQALSAGADGARALFDLVDRRLGEARTSPDSVAATVYDTAGIARAWVGRPSDIRVAERLSGPPSFFVIRSPLGLRLVHILPIVDAEQRRVGSVAAEYVLSPSPAAATIAAPDYALETPIGSVALRMRWEGAGDQSRLNAFLLHAPGGEPLVEASIAPREISEARNTWRRRVAALVLVVFGITILLLIGPLLDRRASTVDTRRFIEATLAALALLGAGTATLWVALAIGLGERPPTSAVLLLCGVAVAAAVALLASPIVRVRVAWRTRRTSDAARLQFLLLQLCAGAAVGAILVLFGRLLPHAVDPSAVDLRHFSLHPWNAPRLGLLMGILAAHAAALWACTLILGVALARWRIPRGRAASAARLLVIWVAPAAAAAALAYARGWTLPALGLVLSAAACAIAALAGPRAVVWYRHTTVAARMLALFVAFLLPALLLYPSVDYFAEAAMRSLIATRYAVEVQTHSQTLQDQLAEARQEIDAMTVLPALVTSDTPMSAGTSTDRAFFVWSQTALARARLTSAVELYDQANTLVSRFALNLPQYSGTAQTPQTQATAPLCQWDVFGEAVPFGSEERRMLHAEKKICTSATPEAPAAPVGTIVVHVLFDFRTLPFITSPNPYFEVFRPAEGAAPREGTTGSDVDVAIYGWSLGTIYSSSRVTWPIGDALFARIYDPGRRPFWTTIASGNSRYRVYFSNDRVFIYAIGYRTLTLFDHLVHLAELTTLSASAYVLVLLFTAGFTRVARERPRLGRALLREIRESFYRKLFLAFVLASIIPVLTLALVIRTYFANLLTADVAVSAARTAAVAQRVIEQSNALLQRTEGFERASDDVMVWISQVIDQDVNIFDGAQLVATSKRDLFASGLLATRTPDDVYRAIALQRLPSFVGEDRIGTVPFTIAAAPVRAGGSKLILTVPLANRQREIDRELDDLDRGVHLAALFFILLGAAIGLWMAERIADPVRRLTRATRRIARGDFDAQIAVRSADELRRLVDAFNSMAAELKAQRAQLERTHRLEAWAEMARQVAHEIKNPLTPIQLSAEHLRRVHADRGEPMGDVVESCVSSILGQVRLLRQISAEFSSFASSPTAKPAPADVPEIVADVIDPYRTGLAGRVQIVNNVRPPLPRVFVDRTLVARSLANIVENALHAMPGNGTLRIDASQDTDYVTLRLHDTGVGMDEEALARVFEPYFSTKTTGTGLGLPIARRNIELSGGSIEVESEKGSGTTVTVRLPVVASID